MIPLPKKGESENNKKIKIYKKFSPNQQYERREMYAGKIVMKKLLILTLKKRKD